MAGPVPECAAAAGCRFSHEQPAPRHHRNTHSGNIKIAHPAHEDIINIISACAPPLTFTLEAKVQFYEAQRKALSGIPNSEAIYVLGDFNARVGAVWQLWSTCIGHQGIGSMNDNGQRLL